MPTLSAALCVTQALRMTASDRLNSARQVTIEGRYEEALNEFVWFHDHALEEEPALYGVRLSFALMYWMELAEAYPRAKQVLEEIRDRKTNALIHGEGSRETFHDVEAINEALGCTAHTYSLFVQLASSNSGLAESCSKLALPAIVCEGDFALAARYLPEPENRIMELGQSLNEDIEDLKQLPHPHAQLRDVHIKIYASQVQIIVSIVAGVGHSQDASRLRSLATKLVKSASVRKAIRGVLATKV